MTIILPALAAAFAAFCVWLTVRIVNRKERWAKLTALWLIVVLLTYPLSIGPVMKISRFPGIWVATYGPVHTFYLPLRWVCEMSGTVEILWWYAGLWVDDITLAPY